LPPFAGGKKRSAPKQPVAKLEPPAQPVAKLEPPAPVAPGPTSVPPAGGAVAASTLPPPAPDYPKKGFQGIAHAKSFEPVTHSASDVLPSRFRVRARWYVVAAAVVVVIGVVGYVVLHATSKSSTALPIGRATSVITEAPSSAGQATVSGTLDGLALRATGTPAPSGPAGALQSITGTLGGTQFTLNVTNTGPDVYSITGTYGSDAVALTADVAPATAGAAQSATFHGTVGSLDVSGHVAPVASSPGSAAVTVTVTG